MNTSSPCAPMQWVRSIPADRWGFVFGVIAATIWGGFITISNLGIDSGLLPSDLAFLRYGTAGLVLLPFLLRHAPLSLGGIGWPKAIMLSLLAGPLYLLVGANGYLFAPLAHGAVIQLGVLTLAGMLIAALVFAEHLTARRVAGLAVLLVGLVTVAGPSLLEAGSSAWRGDVLFAIAGLMFAAYAALVRFWKLDALPVTIAVAVVSAVSYTPIYLLGGGFDRLASASGDDLVIQVLVQGLLSGIVAVYAFSKAVEYLGPARASLFPAVAPAIAMVLGVPVLGEWPTLLQWGGLVIATAGLLWAISRPQIR